MMRINRRRQFVCSIVIATCAGAVGLLAAERATVILGDGERITGTITAAGGRGSRNRDRIGQGDLNLLTDDGREIGIPLERLAVIQFGGGQPTAAELGALPRDKTQMMVRRNGTRESGQYLGIAGDEMVRWQSRNGREQMIPFRDLARIYLNADRARVAFDGRGQAEPGFRDRRDDRGANRNDRGFGNGDDSGVRNGNERGGGNNGGNNNVNNAGNNNRRGSGGGGADTRQNVGDVRVEANQWTNTRLDVRTGDMVSFRASGRINFGQGATQTSGPEGNESLKLAEYPVSGAAVGTLIGRVGNGAPFAIGSNAQPIRMPANGALMLGVNDNQLGDNTGAFTVAVTRQ